MADLYTSIAQRILPSLGQEPAHEGGMRAWFARGSYRGAYHVQTGEVVLSDVSPNELINYLSFDFERFSLASWETFLIARIESKEYNLVSWPILKLYYSAFFAAHAIMRSTGGGITKIDREQIDIINYMVLNVSGVSPNLTPGMFQCWINEVVPGELEVRIRRHNEGNGVHDGFWKAFSAYLEDMSSKAVASNYPDATAFVAGVHEIVPKLKGWLTSRRNEINYQQQFGVWYPVVKSQNINRIVMNVKRQDSRNIDLTHACEDTLPCFIATTQFLACLNFEIGNYVSIRSNLTRAFGSKWRRFHQILREFD